MGLIRDLGVPKYVLGHTQYGLSEDGHEMSYVLDDFGKFPCRSITSRILSSWQISPCHRDCLACT